MNQLSQLLRQVPGDRNSIDDVLAHILDCTWHTTPAGPITRICVQSQGTTLRPIHDYHDLRRCCLDISHPVHAILHTFHHPHPHPLTLGVHPFL